MDWTLFICIIDSLFSGRVSSLEAIIWFDRAMIESSRELASDFMTESTSNERDKE